MAKRQYESNEQALAVAKEAMWLAYVAAGGTHGMGFMRGREDATKDQVWDCAYNMGDYSGRGTMADGQVNADYVFGRMLKLRFVVAGDSIEHDDYKPRGDYQSWCWEYPSFDALFDAAEQAVKQPA